MIPAAETAIALERGVVDGLGYTYGGLADRGLAEYLKYVIDHPFYTQNSAILFNMKAWKSLPDDLKDKIESIMKDYQVEYVRYTDGYKKSQDDLFKSKGLQFIKFSPEEGKKLVDAAYAGGWKEFLKKNPKTGPEIKAVAEINY